MAYSQFTIYSSHDSGSPVINAATGSLITLLDSVLVTGYGSKAAAGWSKPIANTGNIGCWKQPSGSLCTLVVNDSGLPTGFAREAWACGWDYLTDLGSVVGTGSGQFPRTNQGANFGSGSVIFRKGQDNTTISPERPRQWICFADAWTFYLFTQTLDTLGQYRACWFGDFFSLRGENDRMKCMIHGNGTQAQATGGTTNGMYEDTVDRLNQAGAGFFLQKNSNGRIGSLTPSKMGDASKTGGSFPAAMVGIIPTVNPLDGSYYMAPVTIGEVSTLVLRGRLRGIYHVCHPIENLNDGQVIYGGNDYAGKTFQIVKQGPNAGMWAIETSNTVETN